MARDSEGELPPQTAAIRLNVNGRPRDLMLDTRTTLLDTLRNHLGLTGTKKGCDHGQCGACTVLVGGERTLSCLTLAAMARGPVTTIEGLAAADGTLHPMQQAFIDQDAFQCGYCTPGQILSAVACVEEGHADSCRRDPRIHERQTCAAAPPTRTSSPRSSRPRRRCAGPDDAAVRLRPGRRRAHRAQSCPQRDPDGQVPRAVSRGRDHPARPDEAGHDAAASGGRHQRTGRALWPDRGDARRAAARRAGAHVRGRRSSRRSGATIR